MVNRVVVHSKTAWLDSDSFSPIWKRKNVP